MGDRLLNKKIAILLTDGFEQIEMTGPRKALEMEGAITHLISPNPQSVQGWHHAKMGDAFDVDRFLLKADTSEYEALLIPGGVMNSDSLRTDPNAIEFVKSFARTGKPIAAICHAPWILIEAGVAKGHTVTSWPSLKTDLMNAGATWVDKEVVMDSGLVTSRKPDDIPAFNAKMIEEFVEGVHIQQHFAA